MPAPKPTKTPQAKTPQAGQARALLIHQREVPLTVRRLKGARRMTVRYRPLTGDVLLTLPLRVPLREGMDFAESRAGWLAGQVGRAEPRRAFADGMTIPVFGRDMTIRHAPGQRGMTAENGEIRVPGDGAFLNRRVRDWLRGQAKYEIERLVRERAARLGKRASRIGVRDTASRWGSCGPDGAMSFSWRLIFAPHAVLDYVVCHEVAHLVELNHGERFWRIVEDLCPSHREMRRWLARHGNTLYAYG